MIKREGRFGMKDEVTEETIEEFTQERLASLEGTVVCYAVVQQNGSIKVEASGTPMEMVTVAAVLLEEVYNNTEAPYSEIEALVREFMFGSVEDLT